MSADNSERPPAHPEFEKTAGELFPYTTLSPEEYAGREGTKWDCFSFDNYRFQNALLDAWIQRLGKILFNPGLVEQYQSQYLTPEEIAEQKKQMEDENLSLMQLLAEEE